jgi:hypothetical protein
MNLSYAVRTLLGTPGLASISILTQELGNGIHGECGSRFGAPQGIEPAEALRSKDARQVSNTPSIMRGRRAICCRRL